MPNHLKRELTSFVTFMSAESVTRTETCQVPLGWKVLCALTSSGYFLYAPRSTSPHFYFAKDGPIAFEGMVGLDIGARVWKGTGTPADQLIQQDDPRQTLTPHWQYYRSLGASMRAIDVSLDSENKDIECGDARLLGFEMEFDFITAPMLLGPSNPCCTALEVAAALREMYRVLRTPGFAYLADKVLHPSVCFVAQLTGFAIAYSKTTELGFPVGTLLLKIGAGPTLPRMSALQALPRVSFHPTASEVVSHCNLADDPANPSVTLALMSH